MTRCARSLAALIAALAVTSCSAGALPETPTAQLAAPAPAPRAPRPDLTILAVGDVNLGRMVGRQILAGRVDEPFDGVRDVVGAADIAFANLESQLSDQNGRTEGASNLVFTGPPAGADALARAGFDVVSTANNHAWDFGERALHETIANLRRVGIAHAGTGATLDEAYAPAYVERNGWKVAFVAVTSIFNSTFESSPARHFVAWGVPERVAASIAAARAAGADLVFVSHHAGVEYSPTPTDDAVAFARACIDAGADGVIGHHPHVVQGVEWHRGKPIFHSLGNFLFKQLTPWTDRAIAVRMIVRDGGGIEVEYLPVAVSLKPGFLDDAAGAPVLGRVAGLSGGTLVARAPGARAAQAAGD